MGGAIGWFLFSLALGPGLILIHELGHALAVVLLTGDRTLVTVGSGGRYAGLRVGRVRIRLYGNQDSGSCRVPPRASPRDVFAISLAGPAAELVAAAVLAIAFVTIGRPLTPYVLLGLGTLTAVVSVVWNLVPRQSGELASDGWNALTAWRRFRGTPHWRTPLEQLWHLDDQPAACRQVLQATVGEAERAKSPHVGTEHLLIAVADSDGDAGRVLRDAGLDAARLRAALPSTPQASDQEPPRNTAAFKRVLEASRRYLTLRGDQEVTAEHLLLALLQERHGSAVELVDALGASRDALRSALVRAMAGSAARAS